jgi:ribose transport system substrate-binding protein
MTQAESMLQAHPNIKAFLGVNDGGILGACEVLEARGVSPDDYGCFGMDAIEEALTKIRGNTPYKMTINFGTANDQVNDKLKCIRALHDGNYEKVYYAPTNVVDKSNVNNG